MGFTRYALYYLPPPDEDWARFATHWLGWDCIAGRMVSPPALDGLPRPSHEITAAPRRYGLHATIKPPFRLADGVTRADLQAACAAFCAATHPLRLDGLALTTLGRFLAIRPIGDETALNALANRCVRELDPFRAPLTTQERAHRAAGLRPDLARNLDRWGYPHVMEAFRFHITLTGPLTRKEREATRKVLARHLTPVLPHPFILGDLALVGEDANGFFHSIEHYPLSG